MYDLIGFGNEIKGIRKSNGLTQSDVASRIGMQRDTFSRLENGKSTPKIATLDKLSYLYKQDILLIFTQYRVTIDTYISKHINNIFKHFRNHTPDIIEDYMKDFEETFSNTNLYSDEYYSIKRKQFHLYLEALEDIHKVINDASRQVITELFLSLNITKKNLFKRHFRLDKLEIRIIILLAAVYRFKNEFIDTMSLLNIALEELLMSYSHDNEFLSLYLLIQGNKMSFYHRIDDFEGVKEIYQDCLGVIDDKLGIRHLYLLFIRAGLNKHFKEERHLDGLVAAGLQLIKDGGDQAKYDRELKILQDKYDFLKLEEIYKN